MLPMPILQNPSRDNTINIAQEIQKIINESLQIINNQIIDGLTKFLSRLNAARIRRREEVYDTGDVAEGPPKDYADVGDLDDEAVLEKHLHDLVPDEETFQKLKKGELGDGHVDTEEPEDLIEDSRRRFG
jgi:hypothetical protein